MPKTKYKYNPHNFSFEEISLSIWKRIFKLMLWLAPSLVVGLIFSFFFTRQINSPKEKALKRDLAIDKIELERLLQEMQVVNNVVEVLEKRDEDLYRVTLYAEKLPDDLKLKNVGKVISQKYSYLDGLTNSNLLQVTSEKLDDLEKRILNQSISFRDLLNLARNKEKMLANIPAIQPVNNTDLKRMASGYGYRIDPIYKTRKMHTGMDFTADIGTEVYVTGDGVIETIEVSGWGYGKCIVVNHGFGYKTRYAHLSEFKVLQGQKVRRGEIIGLVGSTGKSVGPHLHYEVEKGGVKINPLHYYHSDLTAEQYEKLLELSNNSFKAFD
jgi:murein DD-endopeptidase MepM/ murein hydrolase activator NlpD